MSKISTPYTFNKSKGNISYCHYNGGWSSWSSSKLNGGYAGDGSSFKYCVALKFTTPAFDGVSENFKIIIPYCRSINTKQAASGILKLKLTDSDPRNGTLSDALANCTVTANWSAKNSSGYADRAIHTLEVTFTDSLAPNKTYYIVIGVVDGSGSGGSSANQDWIEIGENNDDDPLWKATLNTYYTEGGTASIRISDNGNNTFTISGALGTVSSPNSMTGASLYYTTNGQQPNSATGYTTKIDLEAGSGKSYTSGAIAIPSACSVVWAVTYNSFKYGTSPKSTGHISEKMKYYVAPKQPGTPALTSDSLKNNRLTIKQNWTYSWAAAEGGNTKDYNAVQGYWIRIWRWSKATEEWAAVKAEDDITATSYTFDPNTYGFVVGDKVQFEVAAFSKNGKGDKLWSPITNKWNGYDLWTGSVVSTVENAGVVNIKVNTGTATKPVYEWVEGQVWVKIAQGWVEAETVNVKTNDGWQGSQ